MSENRLSDNDIGASSSRAMKAAKSSKSLRSSKEEVDKRHSATTTAAPSKLNNSDPTLESQGNGARSSSDSVDANSAGASNDSSGNSNSRLRPVVTGFSLRPAALAKRFSSIRTTSINKRATREQEEKVKEGYLWKRGGGPSYAWKKRYFVMTNNQLLYYFKTDPSKESQAKPRGCIELKSDLEVLSYKDPNREHSFQLAPKDSTARAWYLSVDTPEEMSDWIFVLKDSISGQRLDKATVSIEENLRARNHFISPDDLQWMDDTIGAGGSGIVKKGMWLNSTVVAIKMLLNLPEFTTEEERLEFYQEISLLSGLRHPNIVSMYGYTKKGTAVGLITEFITEGSLDKLIHAPEMPLPDARKLRFAMNVCRGMVYLHSKKVIHRDLKPANILIDSLQTSTVKVCDFGLSGVKNSGIHSSPRYSAPELSDPGHTEKVDVFSFAVILWEMCERRLPWEGVKSFADMEENVKQGKRLDLTNTGMFKSCIASSWHQDPSLRPPFYQLFIQLQKLDSISEDNEILEAWGVEPSLAFDNLADVAKRVLDVDYQLFLHLKPFISLAGKVDKQRWIEFISPFLPLKKQSNYLNLTNNGETKPDNAWSIEEVVAVCSLKYFVGFLTTAEVYEAFRHEQEGSFLIRYSSSPGNLALSCCSHESIKNWRIQVMKRDGMQQYILEGQGFLSLSDLISHFSVNAIGDSGIMLGQPINSQQHPFFMKRRTKI